MFSFKLQQLPPITFLLRTGSSRRDILKIIKNLDGNKACDRNKIISLEITRDNFLVVFIKNKIPSKGKKDNIISLFLLTTKQELQKYHHSFLVPVYTKVF